MATTAPIADAEMRCAVARAVRRAAAGAISVDQAVAEAIRAVSTAFVERTPAERAAQESARLLAEYDSMGADRAAASKVARRHSSDPLEQDHIAQRIRRLARRRKTNPVRLAG